jgi:RHS repeat-associated protein
LQREVLRTQGQLSSRFDYDSLGRRTRHQVLRHAPQSLGVELEPVLTKSWKYDLAGELIEKGHSRRGVTRYAYDPLGRILHSVNSLLREAFQWDNAANMVASNMHGGYVKYNRLYTFEDKRYHYDAHGRLASKQNGAYTDQTFTYDAEHRLIEVRTRRNGVKQSVRFEYDALGRRIRKADAFGHTDFIWDGMQLLEERRGSTCLTYLYEPDSYVPLARLDHRAQAANDMPPSSPGATGSDNVYYFHNDVSGLPEELTDSQGRIVWQAHYKTWGNTVTEEWVDAVASDSVQPQALPQNLRYQGQYLDRETGLHYNTFRYYDPDIGRFITEDPIGLNGGINLYQYAPNPLLWMDPWGWCQARNGKLKAVGKDKWESSGGLIYGPDKKFGNRVLHVLAHTVPDASKPKHSVFNVGRRDVLGLVDEAWGMRGAPLPKDPGAYVVPMGRTVGTAGETAVKIVVQPGTNNVISAYPVVP